MILFSIFLLITNLFHIAVNDSLLDKLALLAFASLLYKIFKFNSYSKKNIDRILGLCRKWTFIAVRAFPPLSIPLYIIARFALPAGYGYVALNLPFCVMAPI